MMLRSPIRRFRSYVLVPLSFLSVYGQEQPAKTAPGVLVRLYDIGQPMHALPELAPGQLPNTVKILPAPDLDPKRGDFGELTDRFMTEVTGFLRIEEPGTYGFRLMSDDGAKLWIDGQLVIDHDGLHGPTPKDGEVELNAGKHGFRILHFESGGGEQLTLLWRSASLEPGQYVAIPSAILSHDDNASKSTSPGRKRIIKALRRGKPGDGTAVAGVHPSFDLAALSLGAVPGEEKGSPGEAMYLAMHFGACQATEKHEVGSVQAQPPIDRAWMRQTIVVRGRPRSLFAWLPAEAGCNRPTVPCVLNSGTYKAHLLVGDAESGSIKRIAIDPAGKHLQGAVFRFATGTSDRIHLLATAADGRVCVGGAGFLNEPGSDPASSTKSLKENSKTTFEMFAVRAMSNGFEIEFTKPLDPRVGWEAEAYYIEQRPFTLAVSSQPLPKATGWAPRRDGIRYPVKSASVSEDRKRVFLEIDNLKTSHVVYLRLLPPCISEDGELPWSTEAWYTLNAIPTDRRGTIRSRPPQPTQNVLTDVERAAGWRLLFDGKTTKGWRGFKKDTFPAGWEVIGGCLVLVRGGGDIITEGQFDNFELRLEWRISAGGNSGIFFRVSEEYRFPWDTGPEMQVLDNSEHVDGRSPLTSAGSNYALHAPPRDVTQPVGLFNKVRLRVDGNRVEHWLNGEKVVEYELHSPAWKELVAKGKFSKMPHYGMMSKGHIDLQDHGDKVWYRNIKIRPLARE